jgi:arylsulfatase A-like enzyme
MIIKKEQYTVARLMQDAGYVTGVVGKWHLGLGEGDFNCQDWNGLITPGPSDIGFGYSFIMAATGDRTPCVFIENGRIVNLDPDDPVEISYTAPFPGEPTGKDNPELLKMHPSHGHNQAIVNGISRIGYMKGGKSALWIDENIADTIASRAVQFIEKNKSNPFLLYIGTQDIHVPRVPHARFSGITGMGPRGDAIAEFDWIVGRVLETIDLFGLTENTMVILTSDNGPVVDDGYKDMALEKLGNHKPWGSLRGGKYSIFEAGTGIPFIVRWPGHIKPGVSESPISQIDLFATMAQLTGQQIPAGAASDSQGQLNAWTGKSKAGREFVIQQSIHTLSIIVGNWKYICPGKGPAMNKSVNIELGNDSIPQLYDVQKDRGEKNNVAGSHPEVVKRLSVKLDSIRNLY